MKNTYSLGWVKSGFAIPSILLASMLFFLSATLAQAQETAKMANQNSILINTIQSNLNAPPTPPAPLAPFSIQEDGECSQITEGNNVENGYGNLHALIFANDIALNPGESFSLESFEVNLLMEPNVDVDSADIYIYEDSADGNGPGDEIYSLTNQSPTSSVYLEEAFGFDLDKVTFTFDEPIELTGSSTGKVYWLGMIIESTGESAYMEITTLTNTPNEIYYLDNNTQNWVSSTDSDENGGFEEYADGVISFFGQCVELDSCDGELGEIEIVQGEEMEICENSSFTLTASMDSEAGGLVFQWQQKDPEEDEWTDIEDANDATYSTNGLTVDMDFRIKVECSTSGDEVFSDPISITIKPAEECYCIPAGTSASYYIDSFTTTGAIDNVNNTSTGFSSGGYGDYTELTISQEKTGSVDFSTTISGGTAGFRIWVDWNGDGEFSANEVVYQSSAYSASHAGSFTVPETAISGETRMRMVSHWLDSSGNIDPCSTSHTYGEFEDYTFNIIELEDCAGELSAGTPTEDSLEVCAGLPFLLSVSDASGAANGLVRKWQSSPAGEDDWTDIEGSSSSTLNYTGGVLEDTDFRYVVNCNETEDVISDVIEVTLKPGNECYCTPVYTYGCSSNDLISNVSLTGESEILDNDSGCSDNNYGDYTDLTPPDLAPGETYTISVSTIYTSPSSENVKAWIDYNHNGIFEDSEEIANTNGGGLSSSGTSDFEFTVPEDIEPGNYRLRVRLVYGSAEFDSCSSASYGETEDYTVEIIQLEDCEGPVTAGTIEEDFDVCAGNPFTVSVEDASDPANGLVRQWQSSPAGEDDWTDIEGGHSNTFNIVDGIMEDTDFRYSVTCNDGDPEYSEVLQVTLKPGVECYCEPTYLYGCASYTSYNIVNVSLTGESEVLDNDTGCDGDGYSDFTDLTPANLAPGETYDLSVTTGYSLPQYVDVRVWIDFDSNGAFTEDELMASTSGGFGVATENFDLTVPDGIEAGEYRMRVRLVYNLSGYTEDSCAQANYGETEDYTVSIIQLDECSGTPNAGEIEEDFSVCAGNPFTISVADASDPANGLTRQWQTSPAGEEDWVDIEGAHSNTYNMTGGIMEDTDFRYAVTCNDGETQYSEVLSVTLNPGYECYCIPVYTSACSSGDLISNVTLTGESDIIDNDSECSPNNYGDYTDLTPADLAPGETYTISVSTTYGSPTFEDVRAWIDYNKNGIFEDSEEIANTNGGGLSSSGTSSFEFTVPDDVEPGEIRMRVRMVYSSSNIDPCGSASYGETEDYTVSIIELEDCSGTPVAGEIQDDFSICAGDSFSISVSDPSDPANGLVRQWQSSPAGENDWTDIEGAHSNTFNVADGILEDTDFRYSVKCNDDDTVYSDILTVTLKPGNECYCIPTGSTNNSDEIVNFSLNDFSNDSSPSEGTNGYSDYTDLGPITLIPGVEYVASLTSGSGSGNHGAAIWIDYNDDGFFSEDERVTWIGSSIPASTTAEFPAFMAGVQVGEHRLRVQYTYSQSGENLDPCNITSSFSETEDYTVVIVDVDCFPPTAITIGYITDNSAQVTWEGSGETEWMLYYGEAGFDPETEGESIQVLDEPLANLEDLAGSTTYDVYIKTICEGEDSVLIGPKSFTTLITPPVNTRLCDAIMLDANSGCVGGPWTNVGAFEQVGEPVGSCLNDFHGTNSVWFSFVAPANGMATITTNFSTTNFNVEMTAFAAPEDCEDITTLGEEVGCAPSNEDLVLDGLTPGATYYVKVTGFNNAEGDFCIEVQMDDTPAPCEDPSDIVVTDVEDTFATVEWTANGSESQWEVAYGLAGFDLGSEGQTEVVNTNSIVLTNLEPETEYDVYVRAICDANQTSDWVGPNTFTTEPMSVSSEIFNNFSYYPNPVKEALTLKAAAQIEKVEVYNLLGQLIMTATPNTMEAQLNTDQLQSGAYLMKVSIEGATKTFRVIKK